MSRDRRLTFLTWVSFVVGLHSLSMLAFGAAPEVYLGPWQIRHPHPTDYARGIAHDGRKFVLVDGYGQIFTSVSSRNWTLQSQSPLQPLSSVTYGADRFIAVGPAGTIFSSIEGTNWLAVPSPVTNDLQKVLYTAGQFVIVGANGTILTSKGGQTFDLNSSGSATDLTDIAAGPNALVAVGVPSRGPTTVLVSTNQGEWKQAVVTITNFHNITYFKGAYHCGWYASTNPMFWTNQIPNKGFSNIVSLAATTNAIARNINGRIHISSNGTDWSVESRLPVHPYLISTISNRFVVTGSKAILFGDDFHRLTPRHLLVHEDDNATFFRSIAGGTNGYVVVDVQGRNFYSPDAQCWRRQTLDDPIVNASDIAYAQPPFARFKSLTHEVEVSEDGQQWERISTPSGVLAAASVGNVIVAGGFSNLWVTTDRVAWTKVGTRTGRPLLAATGGSAESAEQAYTPWISSLTSGKGMIVATTGWGELLFSTNGYEWSTNQTIFPALDDATFTPDGLIVLSLDLIAEARFDGRLPATDPPRFTTDATSIYFQTPLRYNEIQFSTDLVNWPRLTIASTNISFSVSRDSNRFLRAIQPD